MQPYLFADLSSLSVDLPKPEGEAPCNHGVVIGDRILISATDSRLAAASEIETYVVAYSHAEGIKLLITSGGEWVPETGETVVGRLLAPDAFVLFDAVVIEYSSHPLPCLHLSYPINLRSPNKREDFRVPTNTPVTIQDESTKPPRESLQGTLLNISVGGGLIRLPFQVGDIGDEFLLHLAHDNSSAIDAACKIRHLRSSTTQATAPFLYGVSFERLLPEQRLLLAAQIFDHFTACQYSCENCIHVSTASGSPNVQSGPSRCRYHRATYTEDFQAFHLRT